MMGQRGGSQETLFYSFNLDDHVPSDHLLRCPSRAVREYLAALDEANQSCGNALTEVEAVPPPKSISLTDRAARWTAAPGGPAFFAYSTNYLIDLYAGIIMDVEATPANRAEEVESTKTMVDRVEQRLAIKPRHLVRRHDLWHGANACLDCRAEEDRASRSGLGEDPARWHVRERRVPLGRTTQRVSMPRWTRNVQRLASIRKPANPHYEGRYHHLQIEPAQSHRLLDEGTVLP
jgi:hypothetical protein